MTDDISKVDIPRYVLRIEGGATGWGCYPHTADDGDWCRYSEVLRSKFYADLVSDRLESTPADVGTECAEFVNMVGDEFGNDAGVRLRDLFATLARQLAEAKDTARSYIEGAKLDALTRSDMQKENRLLQSQLAEATRRLGEVEGALERFVHDAEEVDVGGGDAVVTTCESLTFARAALTKEPTK